MNDRCDVNDVNVIIVTIFVFRLQSKVFAFVSARLGGVFLLPRMDSIESRGVLQKAEVIMSKVWGQVTRGHYK